MSNETHMKVVRTIEPLVIKLSGAALRSVEVAEAKANLLFYSLEQSVAMLDRALSVPKADATGDDIADALEAACYVNARIQEIEQLPSRYKKFSIENRWSTWPLCGHQAYATDAPKHAATRRVEELKAAGSILPGPDIHTSECWRDAAKRGL